MKINQLPGCYLIQDLPKDEFDLDKTLCLGQCFRWRKHPRGFWYGLVNNHPCVINVTPHGILTTASIDDFVKYFDLTTDYKHMFDGCDLTPYERRLLCDCAGMHILHQDLLEMIITITISQRTQMPRIRDSVNEICRLTTEPYLWSFDGVELEMHPFPTLEQLSTLTLLDYEDIGLGYRAEYVYKIVKRLQRNPYELQIIPYMNYPDSVNYLKQFRGIGNKVANCIALFSLHQLEAFPIDTHIEQVLSRKYPEGFDITRLGKFAGVMQQYMFYDETK